MYLLWKLLCNMWLVTAKLITIMAGTWVGLKSFVISQTTGLYGLKFAQSSALMDDFLWPDASGHAWPDPDSVRSLGICLLLRPTTAPDAATSVRSLNDQRPVTSSDLYLFCLGRRWHHRTVRTLRADSPPVKFLTLAPKLHHPWSNVPTTKCITLCTCVSIFSQTFSRVLALH